MPKSARWGDAKTAIPRNKIDDWLPELNALENNFFPVRTGIVINQLKAAELYAFLEPTVFRENGIALTENIIFSSPMVISLVNPNTQGAIYYTTDGSDPRVVGGTVSSSAMQAPNNTTLNIAATTVIKSRIASGQTWSALKEISFSSGNEDYSNLKVTEVHYHPADLINGTDTVDGKDLEFLELKNTGNSALNISEVTIDTAVYFTVPQGVILPPKAFYVVASKPGTFYEYYGINASGNFQGNLSNAGEFILINDKSANKILSFTFSDDFPWPAAADGDGNSLSANTSLPTGDPNDYGYWKSSIKIGGSPFADDETSTSVGTIKADENRGALAIYPNPASDAIYVHIDEQVTGTFTLTITDLDGNNVLVRDIENDSQLSLSAAGLAPGVYIVTAEYKSTYRRAKLVYLP